MPYPNNKVPEGFVTAPEFVDLVGMQCEMLKTLNARTPLYVQRYWLEEFKLFNTYEVHMHDTVWEKHNVGPIINVATAMSRYMWSARTGYRFPTLSAARVQMDWHSNYSLDMPYAQIIMNYRGSWDDLDQTGIGGVFFRVRDPISATVLHEGEVAIIRT